MSGSAGGFGRGLGTKLYLGTATTGSRKIGGNCSQSMLEVEIDTNVRRLLSNVEGRKVQSSWPVRNSEGSIHDAHLRLKTASPSPA
eukprot:582624-Rhodomonas_salina.1